MRILVVSAFSLKLNTSSTLQNLIVIGGFTKLGHSVDVLTTEIPETHEAYDSSLPLHNINNYFELKLPTVYTVLRTKKKQSKLATIVKEKVKKIYKEFKVIDAYATTADTIDSIKFVNMDYDCIVSFSDPKSSHVIAQKVIAKYNLNNVAWIQYWGDPLYIDISRERNRLFEDKVRRIEKELLKDATKIVYATPFTADMQKSLYSQYIEKIDYCTQGCWEEYRTCKKINNEQYTIGYFGSYNPKIRNIVPLYKAMEQEQLEDCQLLLAGSGMKLESKKNINILGHLKHDLVHKYEQKCDLLICLLNNRGTQIPGKLYYYASFNKPLLVIVDGDYGDRIKEFLSTYNRYIFCENTTESIVSKINEIKYYQYDDKNIMSEKFNPEYIANKILKGI